MNKLKEITFIEALQFVRKDMEKLKKYLKDERPGQVEKHILQAWIHLQGNYFEEALSLLSKIPRQTSPVIESQRLLILGITYNNKSEFYKSTNFLEDSIEILDTLPLENFQFIAYDNLFIAGYNLRLDSQMQKAIQLMANFSHKTSQQQASFHKAQFLYFSLKHNFAKAELELKHLKSLVSSMSPAQYISYMIGRFDFYVKKDDYKNANATLESLKKLRKFNHGSNYKFMRGLLDYCFRDEKLYLYLEHFKQHPALFWQIKTLLALEESNQEEAKKAWNKLAEISPGTYLPQFKYKGDKNIFSMSLHKALTPKVHSAFDFSKVKVSKLERSIIEFILEGPVNKEELYFAVYQKPLELKSDLIKLTKFVSRIREKHHINIKTKKGCYFVDHEVKQAG